MDQKFVEVILTNDADAIDEYLKNNTVHKNKLDQLIMSFAARKLYNVIKILIKYGADDLDYGFSVSISIDDKYGMKFMIENGAKNYIYLTNDQMVELLYDGLKIENIKKHRIYNIIINHRAETVKHLPLPKELINIVNSYQII
jgi:hypothetical protein